MSPHKKYSRFNHESPRGKAPQDVLPGEEASPSHPWRRDDAPAPGHRSSRTPVCCPVLDSKTAFYQLGNYLPHIVLLPQVQAHAVAAFAGTGHRPRRAHAWSICAWIDGIADMPLEPSSAGRSLTKSATIQYYGSSKWGRGCVMVLKSQGGTPARLTEMAVFKWRVDHLTN